MTAVAVETSVELAYREMIPNVLWTRLINRLVEDEELAPEVAALVMNEALGFLKVCAEHPEPSFSPSPMVDMGWHTFILYTRPYADFCQRYAGKFIHHNPSDEEGVDYASRGLGMAGTLQFMIDHGYPVNVMLWTSVTGERCANPCADRCQARCDKCERCENS